MGRLEAIAVSLTSNEINSGVAELFLRQFMNIHGRSLDLLLVVNNGDYNIQSLTPVMLALKGFRTIKVLHANIPKKDDIYSLSKLSKYISNYIPRLGTISGPNTLFFYIMRYCSQYDTILLLECDCRLKESFLDTSIEYVKHNTFFISGSKYLGSIPISNYTKDHLNGVAFYNTGSDAFQTFIKNVESYIETYVRHNPVIAYDVAMYMYIYSLKDVVTRDMLFANYKTNSLILNFSPKEDANTDMKYIHSTYPLHVILHKKPTHISMLSREVIRA